MAISMENYYFSCDKRRLNFMVICVENYYFSGVTLKKIKLMAICMENYYFSCDTEEDQT